MPRNQQVNFKLTIKEREFVDEVCGEVGLSRADLYLEAVDVLLNDHPKKYKKLVKKSREVMAVMEVKKTETDSGDFLGSFEKYDEKIKRIEEAFDEGRIDEELYDMLVEQTTKNYKKTQKIHKKQIKRRNRKR